MWPRRVGWLSGLKGVRQARPPQPWTPRRALGQRLRAWTRQVRPIPRIPDTISSAATSRAISVHAAHQFAVRVHEPRPLCAGEHPALGPTARPVKRFEHLLASVQVVDGSARPRVELLLQHIHAENADEPLARKSTLGKCPNVSGSIRTVQKVSELSDPAASGAPKRPASSEAPPRSGCQRTSGTPRP